MTDIKAALLQADGSWNVGVLGQSFMEILRANPRLTLADIENHLRLLRSNTYLIAKPLPAPVRTVAALANGAPANYWLWVCLHGEREMYAELRAVSTTLEQNRKALETTGFLVVPE